MGIAVIKSLLAWEACKCGEWGFRLRLRCDTRVVVVISKASMDLAGAVDWSDSLTENLDICDSSVTESTTLHHIYTFHGQVSVHTRSFYGQQLRMSRMMSANRSYGRSFILPVPTNIFLAAHFDRDTHLRLLLNPKPSKGVVHSALLVRNVIVALLEG